MHVCLVLAVGYIYTKWSYSHGCWNKMFRSTKVFIVLYLEYL